MTDLDPSNSIHTRGSQSAPVTLGLCRMSRRKRKTTNPTVRKRARVDGKWRPITSVKEKTGVAGRCQMSEDRGQRAGGQRAEDGD